MIGRTCALLRMQPPVVDNRGLLNASGATVPVDGTDGYQTGCTFQHTDGGDDTAYYVNEGTITSCDFNPVTVGTAGEMSQIEFDDDLTGPLISIDTTDPTGDSYTTPFLITGTYSSTCALGIQLSATNQRPVSFLFDDGAAVLGSGNYRGVLSRVMLCATQTGQVAIRAIRGQVKVADAIDVNIATNEMNAFNGVEGYIELSGATAKTVGANTRIAAVHGLVEVNQDITLTAGGKIVGLYAELSQVTAKSVSGIGTAGVLVDRLDSDHTTNQAKWTIGLMVSGPAVNCGIQVGAYASSQALGSAVVMTATYTAACAVFGETAADLTSAYMTRAIRGRHVVNVAGAVNQETYGVQGQLVTKSCTLGHLHAGVIGTFEGSTSTTLNAGVAGYALGHACVIARPGGMANITATTPLSGFLAFRQDGAMAGGSAYAYSAYSKSGWTAWDIGFYASGCTTGIAIAASTTALLISTCATGITFSGTLTDGIIFSSAIFAADQTRTARVLEIGGRSTAEVDVTFASGTGQVENFEPIQMNFNLIGANPDALSTVNIWQGAMYLDTDAMADIRLKWTDLLTVVNVNCTDVFVHQAEVQLGAGTNTISGQVDVLGLVLDAGSGAVTCASYRVINATLRGAGTPVGSAGMMVNAEGGIQVYDGVRVMGTGIITAFRCGNTSYGESPTHFLGVPTAGTQPVNADASAANVKAEGSIAIRVGNQTRYIQYFNANS